MKHGYIEFMASAAAEGRWAARERAAAAERRERPSTWREIGEARP